MLITSRLEIDNIRSHHYIDLLPLACLHNLHLARQFYINVLFTFSSSLYSVEPLAPSLTSWTVDLSLKFHSKYSSAVRSHK